MCCASSKRRLIYTSASRLKGFRTLRRLRKYRQVYCQSRWVTTEIRQYSLGLKRLPIRVSCGPRKRKPKFKVLSVRSYVAAYPQWLEPIPIFRTEIGLGENPCDRLLLPERGPSLD